MPHFILKTRLIAQQQKRYQYSYGFYIKRVAPILKNKSFKFTSVLFIFQLFDKQLTIFFQIQQQAKPYNNMSSFKDDYIQKYGHNALQMYQRNNKIGLSKNFQSKQHKQCRQATSPYQQAYLIKKSNSKKKLKQSQSKSQLRSTSQSNFQKGFVPKSSQNGFTHTFNSLNNPKKQSLVITSVNSPKQGSPMRQRQLKKSLQKKNDRKLQKVENKIEQILKNSKNGCDMLNGISQCLEYMVPEVNFKKSLQIVKQIMGSVIKQMKQLYRKQKQQAIKIEQYEDQINKQKSTSDSNSKFDHYKITIKNLQQQINYYKNKQFAILNAMQQFRVPTVPSNPSSKHSKRHSQYLPNIATSSNQKQRQIFEVNKIFKDQMYASTNPISGKDIQNLKSFGKTQRQSEQEDSGSFSESKSGPFYKNSLPQ